MLKMNIENLRPLKTDGISGVEIAGELVHLMQDDENIYAGDMFNTGFAITHTFAKDEFLDLDEQLQDIVDLLEEEAYQNIEDSNDENEAFHYGGE